MWQRWFGSEAHACDTQPLTKSAARSDAQDQQPPQQPSRSATDECIWSKKTIALVCAALALCFAVGYLVPKLSSSSSSSSQTAWVGGVRGGVDDMISASTNDPHVFARTWFYVDASFEAVSEANFSDSAFVQSSTFLQNVRVARGVFADAGRFMRLDVLRRSTVRQEADDKPEDPIR